MSVLVLTVVTCRVMCLYYRMLIMLTCKGDVSVLVLTVDL